MVFVRVWILEQRPTDIFQITVFYRSICVIDLIFHFAVLLLSILFLGGKKTSCMIQQCLQSCCMYPLWILCDCTVLYLSITGNYMVLYVCQVLHTLTNTHTVPVQYHTRLHSHWLCIEYICMFSIALWRCISEEEDLNCSSGELWVILYFI